MEGLGNPPRFKEFPRTGPGEGALRVVGDMEVRCLVRVTFPNEPLADSSPDFQLRIFLSWLASQSGCRGQRQT
jgi:hypothetical protein